MGDYVPTTDEIRERWMNFDGGPDATDAEEFDRWLASRDSDMDALVARLDYNQLSLLSGLVQSELGNRNMRARADNGEDGSGW